MTFGVASVAYNGYGKFVPSWLSSIEKQSPRPIATLVLGVDHGYEGELPDWVNVIRVSDVKTMGALKNLAIEATHTDYILPLGVDDELLEGALQEFEKYDADVIVPQYLYLKDGEQILYLPRVSKETFLSPNFCTKSTTHYFHGASPFKRELWEKHNFKDTDCYNAFFWIDVALESPSFAHTNKACLTYRKWDGSHSSNVSAEERLKRAANIKNYRKEERYV